MCSMIEADNMDICKRCLFAVPDDSEVQQQPASSARCLSRPAPILCSMQRSRFWRERLSDKLRPAIAIAVAVADPYPLCYKAAA